MKKKRSLILSFLLIVALNILVGCVKGEKEEGEKIVPNKETKKIQMISNDRGSSFANTKDGYYTIWHNDENGFSNIMYVDYKTKKQVYLCDKAECKHDNEKCTSYVDPKFGLSRNMLLTDSKYLYFVSSEANMGNSMSITTINDNGIQMLDTPTTVYKMNLDGSNKSLLVSLGSGEVLSDKIFTDGEYIYGVSMKNTSVKIDENNSQIESADYKLIGISVENGEVKEITKWDSNKQILGVYDNKLVIKDLKFEKEITKEDKMNEEKYIEELKKAKNIIKTYDISKDKFEDLNIGESSTDHNYIMYENKVFYYKYNGDKIMAIDLDSKSEEIFLEGNSSNIEQIYDGYMITSNGYEENKEFFIVNIKDKKEEKFSLLKNNGRPVDIIGEFENSFFVESNCDVESEYVEWVGVYQTVEKNRQYALIKKEDYFKGNKSFEKVELIQDELY